MARVTRYEGEVDLGLWSAKIAPTLRLPCQLAGFSIVWRSFSGVLLHAETMRPCTCRLEGSRMPLLSISRLETGRLQASRTWDTCALLHRCLCSVTLSSARGEDDNLPRCLWIFYLFGQFGESHAGRAMWGGPLVTGGSGVLP